MNKEKIWIWDGETLFRPPSTKIESFLDRHRSPYNFFLGLIDKPMAAAAGEYARFWLIPDLQDKFNKLVKRRKTWPVRKR